MAPILRRRWRRRPAGAVVGHAVVHAVGHAVLLDPFCGGRAAVGYVLGSGRAGFAAATSTGAAAPTTGT